MPMTWNEARELEANLQREQQFADMRRREISAMGPTLTRFPLESKARITTKFDDMRLWGDTVTITDYCPFEGEPGLCATHDDYGDIGLIFYLDELEPLP